MNLEETAGSIEMAFGVWRAVGPSNHVLDGGPDPPMRGTILGDFFPIEQHCIWRVVCHYSPGGVGAHHQRLQVRSQGTQSGVGIDGHAHSWYIQQDDAAFYRITSISC